MGYFLSLSKSATITGLESSEWALLIFGVILVVGVVGELKALWWSVWVKRFEWIVLIGIAGELIADGGLFFFSSQLQGISDLEVTQAQKSATQAYDSARDAHRASTAAQGMAETAIREAGDIADRADKLAVLLKTEQETTARFQKQATLAQAALQKELDKVDMDVRRRQPRFVLLADANIGNDSRLKPFRGQRVYIFDCEGRADPLAARNEEVFSTSDFLGNELSIKARWFPVRVEHVQCGPGNIANEEDRIHSAGMILIIPPGASERTRDTAKALALALHDALPGSVEGFPAIVPLGMRDETVEIKVSVYPWF